MGLTAGLHTLAAAMLELIKRESVLCCAAALAVLSCFLVPPDAGYFEYIDYRTLALLFCLMAVMAGFREQGVFSELGRRLLSKAGSMRQVVLALVLLCFFGSMVITNDVALITFVPFAFAVLSLLGPDERRRWILPVVCMQTLAANLGSMLTPIGNPQNLYLYGQSGLSLPAFLHLMLPYAALSLILLVDWALLLCAGKRGAAVSVRLSMSDAPKPEGKKLLLYSLLFIICLLAVARALPYTVMLAAVLAALISFDRPALHMVDYSLLLTFVGFFIFIGNLGRVAAFSDFLSSALNGRETLVAVLASQVVSNVPAALLLSGFTERTSALIVGTNLGGLGTLIASMASLISFRQIANGDGGEKGRYFVMFTVSNLVFLALLLALQRLLALI